MPLIHRPLLSTGPRRSGGVLTALAMTGVLACAGCSSDDPAPAAPTTGAASSPTTTSATSTTPASPATPSATASAGPSSTPGAEDACVQTAFDELTMTQRAGQLVMAGVPAGNPSAGRALVREQHLGSVFLAGRTGDSPATVRQGVRRLSAQQTGRATVGLLVSVDQEGGKVQSLRGGAWTSIPEATVQGGWSSSKLADRTEAWAGQLKQAGVNLDLAPVADTVPAGTERGNPPIGYYDRQFGSTPAAVADSVTTVTRAMRAGGVIPTVKHFPGLGRVKDNTDTSSRAVDARTTATGPELAPFQAGIDAGAGAVMVSSASYPELDDEHLAVFSRAIVTDLLRGRMGYQGVVITDDVGKAVAVRSVPVGQRATRFIAAGGDLVLTVVAEQAPKMVAAIVTKASADAAFRARADEATRRVLRLKQSNGLLTCS